MSVDFNDKKVVGIDYSKRAVDLARALNPDLVFFNNDIINDSLEDKFDAITLIEVFEHIPLEMCNDFVSGLSNLLNENGKIYLTVPHENKSVSYKHFQHFSYSRLYEYFQEHFHINDIVYFDKLSKWNRIIDLLLVNNLFILNYSYPHI